MTSIRVNFIQGKLHVISNLNMLYWYSQKHVHEVFILITTRRKEATLMITIVRSPGTGLFINSHQLR